MQVLPSNRFLCSSARFQLPAAIGVNQRILAFTCNVTVYATIDELQSDLDAWMREFNELRSHQGKWCFGKTPMQTFIDALLLAREKSGQIQATEETAAA